MARSKATQHMSRPYTNGLRPPRVSQTPSSGWSQLSHSQSMISATSVQPASPIMSPALVEQVQRVEELAVDVELQLRGGAVADPHRT